MLWALFLFGVLCLVEKLEEVQKKKDDKRYYLFDEFIDKDS